MSYTLQSAIVRDASTLVNYKAWAKFISDAFASCGWIQGNDSGQVVWTATVLTLTQVASSGGSSVYSYSSFTGPAPRVGMSVIITGFATGGNNVTATLTAVSGGSSGTVTVATTTQGNETHAGSGTTTAISTVPSNSITRDYEIWQPGDGLQTFYLKIQYGTNSASTNTGPSMQISIGTTTNGAGTLSGFTMTTVQIPGNATTVTSTATQWQCYVSGDTGRIAFMLWRDDTTSAAPLFWGLQRSLNSSGTPYGTSSTGYVTLLACANSNTCKVYQQSLVFGTGVAPAQSFGNGAGGWACLFLSSGGSTTGNTFNGLVPLSPVFPMVGKYDNPMDIVAVGSTVDFTEGAQYSIPSGQMPYGVTHNYVCGKQNPFGRVSSDNTNNALLMRFD